MKRRRLLSRLAAGGLWVSAQPRLLTASGNTAEAKKGHNVVLINLRGGFDQQMLVPVFRSPNSTKLTSKLYWPYREVFTSGGVPLFSTEALNAKHPLIKSYGKRLSVVTGISMNNFIGHEVAVKFLMRAAGRYNFAQALGELIGNDTQYGVVSVGELAFRAGAGLSAKGKGIEIGVQAKNATEAFGSLLDGRFLSGDQLDDFAGNYYRNNPLKALMYPLRSDYSGEEQPLTTTQLQFAAQVRSRDKRRNADAFSIPDRLTDAYEEFRPSHLAPWRYHGMAFCAARIHSGGFARVYSLNLGEVNGKQGYDSHDFPEGNLYWQNLMMKADFKAINVFLDQIADHLDNTTVIVQTEFGRPPYLQKPAATAGKDHFPQCNTFLVFSNLFKNQLLGNVNPENGYAADVTMNDGSSGTPSPAHLFRGILETLQARGLFNSPTYVIDQLMRQYLNNPYPKDFFVS